MTNGIYQDAITQSTSVQVGEDAVHELLGKLADDAGLEVSFELNKATPATAEPQTAEPTAEEEDKLQQRLRALRA
jgi:charged multivesicular body protein 1